MDDNDGVASVTSGSVLHGPPSVDSSTSLWKRKTRSGILFRAWSFQMSVKINFSPASSTAGEKRRFLFEHLSHSTGHNRPSCVTCLTVFSDKSHFSGHTDSEGLVSLKIQGYVQTKNSVPLTTMEKWIGSASWKPLPGGLMSDDDFIANMRRYENQYDSWTQLTVFGSVGANNAGRIAKGQARKVNENYHILTFQIVSSNGLRHVILSFEFLSILNYRLQLCMRTGGAQGRLGLAERSQEGATKRRAMADPTNRPVAAPFCPPASDPKLSFSYGKRR